MAGYVKTATCKGVTLKYDDKLPWLKKNNDILLEIKYTTEQGLANGIKEETLNIFGNFNKKEDTWGGALKAKMFFEAVGIKEPVYNENYTIPEEYLDKAVGQQFLVLSYPSTNLKDDGNPWWNTFMETINPSRGMDKLKERFQKQVNEGWVKDYSETKPDAPKPAPKPAPKADAPDLDLESLGL